MTFIQRDMAAQITRLSKKFPMVMLTGPRQSGKSTLLKHIFPKKEYVSLENPDVRKTATNDPKGFLNNFKHGAVLDEVQRVPSLFSYLQTLTDESGKAGQFILSGSQNFLLMKSVTQSLAGRIAILRLMPFSLEEINQKRIGSGKMTSVLFNGFYPRMLDKKIKPADFFPNYIDSYLHRDVRELQHVGDLAKFNLFLHLCAGRIGQLVNMHALSNECGVSQPTIRAWFSVLEASYILFLVQPHHENFNKRLVKTPKLYFCDTGLACALLGIEKERDLQTHSMKGALLENLVFTELLKHSFNQGVVPRIYFWRDKMGNEIDFLIEKSSHYSLIEVKATETFHADQFKGINYYEKVSRKKKLKKFVVYGGAQSFSTSNGMYVPWNNCGKLGE